MARSHGRSRGPKTIDNVRWTLGSSLFAAFAAGQNSLTIVTDGTEEETILRTRGELLCYADTTQVPGGLTQVGVGFLVVPAGLGTTVLSTPLLDADAPWFWYEVFTIGYEEMVTDVIDIPGISMHRSVIDSKAMRKVRPDEEVVTVIESITALTAISVNCQVNARFLIGD